APKGEKLCKICLCDVEDGYILQFCSHEFCKVCLISQLVSSVQNNDFPIRCTDCGKPVLIQDIKSLCSGSNLEKLFQASSRTFISKNQTTFSYCPTPDCTVYYRDESMSIRTCDVCLRSYCVTCGKAYH